MNKNDLLNVISENADITKKTADSALAALAAAVTQAIRAGESVVLPGIGKLSPKVRPARVGRNPQTGAAINLAAKTSVKLTVTKSLIDDLN